MTFRTLALVGIGIGLLGGCDVTPNQVGSASGTSTGGRTGPDDGQSSSTSSGGGGDPGPAFEPVALLAAGEGHASRCPGAVR
ncbi:MAG: hypothetical protein U0359_34675 [Byssovorax sp.]